MARFDSPRRRTRRENNYDEFRETLATPVPRTYREDAVVEEDSVPSYRSEPLAYAYSPAEQLVRAVAGILNALLALRFIIALFTSSTTNAITSVIFNATNWLVTPFQTLFGTPPSGGGGYFDLPALAAIVTVSLLAWLISSLVRDYR